MKLTQEILINEIKNDLIKKNPNYKLNINKKRDLEGDFKKATEMVNNYIKMVKDARSR